LSTTNGGFVGSFQSVKAQLQAIDNAGLIRTLAEPTLTAISGESANFLAGGKFPYPTPPQLAGGAPGFDFQNFGVSLTFTPVVLAEGRISLKVTTEVSELDPENSVTVSGTTVPGLKVRRADTSVEVVRPRRSLKPSPQCWFLRNRQSRSKRPIWSIWRRGSPSTCVPAP
jgi:pilus assembly protein CpaC